MNHLLQFRFQMKRCFCYILDVIVVKALRSLLIRTNILHTLSRSKKNSHTAVGPKGAYTPPPKQNLNVRPCSSMMSEGIELEEFAEADTDLISQEESAFQMRMMMMTKLNMAEKT